MSVNPWLIYPPWLHFSSLFRESVTAEEEPNEFIRFHHYTSALYFGISFVESLLNRKHRELLEKQGITEDKILKTLRKSSFGDKLKNWPALICGRDIDIPGNLLAVLSELYDIRCAITHAKSRGHETYEQLDELDIDQFVTAVAEYAITLHAGLNERYPYWLFGWNYVATAPNVTTPFLINDQQFVHSLASLGVKINAFDAIASNTWRNENMRSIAGYNRIKSVLANAPGCEPYYDQFPFAPRLCKRWWDPLAISQKTPGVHPPMSGGAGLIKSAVKWITPIYPSNGK